MSFEARPDHPTLAHRFFDAIAAGESEQVASLATGDCVIWHNYDQRDKPFSEMVPKLGAFRNALMEFAYQDRRYLPLSDGALALHTLYGRRRADGVQAFVPVAVRLIIAGDLIRRIEEYVDPAGLAPLIAPRP